MAKLSEDVELKKALKRVKVMDKIRLTFLFMSLLLVLFIFYGNKIGADASWYLKGKSLAYEFLALSVMIMLGATILKIVFATAYNQLLKKKNK